MRRVIAKRCAVLPVIIVVGLAVRGAVGHGLPIEIDQNGPLVVSGGTADSNGYAPRFFVQSGGDGAPVGTPTLPNVGPVVAWQIPGFEIDGLDPASSLSIEVLSRPVNNVLPVQSRSLWYWDPTSSVVTPTTSPLYLLGTDQRFATIDPAAAPPAPFLLASPIGGTEEEGGNQGFHNHGLLSYGLDNSPTAATGAYGFFARFTSSAYGPSDPFLVMFNRGVTVSRMPEAAQAINAAAFLPGDFDHNDRVDAVDYVLWRNSGGSAADLSKWRGDFGATWPNGGGAFTNVPEPASALLAIILSPLFVMAWRIRRR